MAPPLSLTQRMQIVTLRESGYRICEISKKMGISRRTIYFWLRRYEEEGSIEGHRRQNYQRSTTTEQDEAILADHKANPLLSTRDLSSRYNVSLGTVRRRLQEGTTLRYTRWNQLNRLQLKSLHKNGYVKAQFRKKITKRKRPTPTPKVPLKTDSVGDQDHEPSSSSEICDDVSLYDIKATATAASDKKIDATETVTEGAVHVEPVAEGYTCSACAANVVGVRYTCVHCARYELCAACGARGAHSFHYVLRVPPLRPQMEVQRILEHLKNLMLEIAREAEIAQEAEIARQAELAQEAEIARQAELAQEAEIARQAEHEKYVSTKVEVKVEPVITSDQEQDGDMLIPIKQEYAPVVEVDVPREQTATPGLRQTELLIKLEMESDSDFVPSMPYNNLAVPGTSSELGDQETPPVSVTKTTNGSKKRRIVAGKTRVPKKKRTSIPAMSNVPKKEPLITGEYEPVVEVNVPREQTATPGLSQTELLIKLEIESDSEFAPSMPYNNMAVLGTSRELGDQETPPVSVTKTTNISKERRIVARKTRVLKKKRASIPAISNMPEKEQLITRTPADNILVKLLRNTANDTEVTTQKVLNEETDAGNLTGVTSQEGMFVQTDVGHATGVTSEKRPNMDTDGGNVTEVTSHKGANFETDVEHATGVTSQKRPNMETDAGNVTGVSSQEGTNVDTDVGHATEVTSQKRPNMESDIEDVTGVTSQKGPNLETNVRNVRGVTSENEMKIEIDAENINRPLESAQNLDTVFENEFTDKNTTS